MADNSPSPREQPEDECYYRHNIRGQRVIGNYFISYLLIP